MSHRHQSHTLTNALWDRQIIQSKNKGGEFIWGEESNDAFPQLSDIKTWVKVIEEDENKRMNDFLEHNKMEVEYFNLKEHYLWEKVRGICQKADNMKLNPWTEFNATWNLPRNTTS